MRYAAANLIRRRGFSMVELLVVIAIIGVLLSLTIGATMQVISVQRDSTTKTALQTFDKTLRAHWEFVTKEAAKEEPSAAVLDLANNDFERARVLWIKLRQAEAFPQCYHEIADANSPSPKLIYGTHPDPIKGQWIPRDRRQNMKYYFSNFDAVKRGFDGTKTNPLAESAACLFLALTVNRKGNKLDEGNLAGNIVDTDSDGIKEIIDGFGRPMRFQRFLLKPDAVAGLPPYNRLTSPLPISDALKLSQDELAMMSSRGDPTDPEGLLRQQLPAPIFNYWCYTTNGNTFAAICGVWFPSPADSVWFTPQLNSAVLPQPYFMPHLVSSGRDEVPFTDDDVYSFRLLRVGS